MDVCIIHFLFLAYSSQLTLNSNQVTHTFSFFYLRGDFRKEEHERKGERRAVWCFVCSVPGKVREKILLFAQMEQKG